MRRLAQAPTLLVRVPRGGSLSADGAADSPAGGGDWRVEAHGGRVTAERTDGGAPVTGRVLQMAASGGLPVEVTRASAGRSARYRGRLLVRARGGVLFLVNELPVELYLRGVVAREMPASAPKAALEAQAIASRTHALSARGRYGDPDYDVRDTTDTQVYDGMDAETAATDAAVKATEGLVLSRGRALVSGEYCDDCGGVTADGGADDVFPPSVIDRLPGMDHDLCACGPHHEWRLAVSLADLARVLPPGVRRAIGAIVSVRCEESDGSGRVRSVEVRGAGEARSVSASALRRALGYERLRSTLFTVAVTGGQVVFTGKGNGHGRGMCQWGAIAQAKPPFSRTCGEILEHYYPGARIVPVGEAVMAHAGRG